ncbi:hypothetical protein GOODEAATRI_019956 [Goodea atripinnis]|uniref:Uncharacterized protein n=1 Tax=Goodea atripinnis TaxID=208336 RepID=A0ABV0PZH5_9TELE
MLFRGTRPQESLADVNGWEARPIRDSHLGCGENDEGGQGEGGVYDWGESWLELSMVLKRVGMTHGEMSCRATRICVKRTSVGASTKKHPFISADKEPFCL